MASKVRVLPSPPSCLAPRRFAGLQASRPRSRMPSEALAKEGAPEHYVYLLQSESFADQRYIGMASDLPQRMADHNAGKSPHTSKFLPWKLVTYIAFSDE